MKLLNLVFVAIVFMSLSFNGAFTLIEDHGDDEDALVDEVGEDMINTLDEIEEPSSLGGESRFLYQQKQKGKLTCNKYPRICRTKRSPGPDCCKKKCVNVMTDQQNCGMCGNRCRYPQICCRGNCVNPRNDRKNCGGCNIRCKRGDFCSYGMCNYA
ncbi:hypothetical protein IFM89_005789 [Coptis chinensis]|uniref:Stigma-specific STIG1-like protein 1 n=1 Tax=Coptis chinensis TaxID=261450 RepID=A0A835IHU3_9MAGN|nr:hypothetical protein IFM89_005789 [Coptis chinensis]